MIESLNKKYTFILASQSPRRLQLLTDLGLDFHIRVKNGIEEDYPAPLHSSEVASYLSKKKFLAYADDIVDNELIITADTVVVLNNTIIGKPDSEKDAYAMLGKLSGHTHTVITGVTIGTSEKVVTFDACTEVTFTNLRNEEIEHYIKQFRPFDKAGSYGIQEWIGYIGIESINGSFYNVMGLPVQQLYHQLLQF